MYHKALETYFKELKDGNKLSLEESLDVYEDVWNDDEGDTDRENISFSRGEESTFLQGIGLFKKFILANRLQPAAVEEEFERPINSKYIKKMVARIDLIDTDDKVYDFKTTYKRINNGFSPAIVKAHMQPTIYSYVLDRPIDLQFIIAQRTEYKIYRRGTKRTQDDIDWVRTKYVPASIAQIESGIFPPVPGTHCSWCPIQKECGYAYNR